MVQSGIVAPAEGGAPATIADGADVVEGTTTGAAVITDVNGTIHDYLRGLIKLAVGAGFRQTPGGTAPTNATSTALEASRIAKATPGTLYGVSGFNNKTTGQYIQLHDSATLPADSAVPVQTQWVPATTPYSFDFGTYGRAFTAGIVVCNSSTLATKTIGSADCWIDAQYL